MTFSGQIRKFSREEGTLEVGFLSIFLLLVQGWTLYLNLSNKSAALLGQKMEWEETQQFKVILIPYFPPSREGISLGNMEADKSLKGNLKKSEKKEKLVP